MNRSTILARLVLSAAFAAFAVAPGAAGAAAPQVAPNVFDQQSGTAAVKTGQYFVLALPANRTTGYGWGSAQFDRPGVAALVGTTYHSRAMRPGAGGMQLLLLKAVAPGTATLTVQYSRPWEKNAKPLRTATLKITVNGG